MGKNRGLPVELSYLEDGTYFIATNPVFKEIPVPWRGGCLYEYLPIIENVCGDWQSIPAILIHLKNPGYTNDAPFYCRISCDSLTGTISFEDIKQFKKLRVKQGKIEDIV